MKRVIIVSDENFQMAMRSAKCDEPNAVKFVFEHGDICQLFGMYCGCMIDIRATRCGDLDSGNFTLDRSDFIYDRIIDICKRGYYDEATHLVAMTGLRTPNIIPESCEMAFLVYSDPIEVDLLKVLGRNMIMKYRPKSGEKPEDESVDNSNDYAYDELPIQMYIQAFDRRYPIYRHAAGPMSKMAKFANFHISEDYHPDPSPPPIGLIPNNQSLCYAATTITILLSIPEISRRISELVIDEAACAAMPKDDLRFLDLLALYCSFLRRGGSKSAGAMLNESLVELPAFERFSHSNCEDSVTFLVVFSNELRRLGIAKTIDPNGFVFFGEPKSSSASGSASAPLIGACGVNMCVHGGFAPCPKNEQRTIRFPFTIIDDVVDRGNGQVFWNIRLDNAESIIRPHDEGCTRGKILLRDVENGECFTHDEAVESAFNGRQAPDILIIIHTLGDSPDRIVIPCALDVGGHQYTLHGASLFDEHYNTQNGHYTSLIVSSTTMFVYDPAYAPNTEDMRVYRVRFLCYIRVR